MSIRVALHHRTRYRFDRPVRLSPQEVRLRPAPHCRTPVLRYSLGILPERHVVDWQLDAHDNWVAWFVFTEPTTALEIVVDLVADLAAIDGSPPSVPPEDCTLPRAQAAAPSADLAPFFASGPPGPRIGAWVERFVSARVPGETAFELVARLNRQVHAEIAYLVRTDPGVQTPDETLERRGGSCRDSGWLLVQLLRRVGFAARFATGYLIQVVADVDTLSGSAGPERDFAELHAWAECFLPGAGWIGLDPTSGRLAGAGHIPVACTPDPANAVAIVGYSDPCNAECSSAMSVTRVHDDAHARGSAGGDAWKALTAIGGAVGAGHPGTDRDYVVARADDTEPPRSASPADAAADAARGADAGVTAACRKPARGR